MIKGLSTAGLGDVKNVEELILLASKNGFDTIETSGQALREFIDEKGLREAKDFLKEWDITIGSIGLAVEWRASDKAFKEGLETLLKDAQTAAQFGCKSCCTYVLPSTDYQAVHFMVLATKRLKLCAQILNEYGINLGLEFVGPHHLRTTWKNPFIWEMQETLDWIDAIGEPNIGLLLDSYHWYTTGGTSADLLALNPAQIVHVHLNDAKDLPIAEVLDNDRLYPGEGVIDLVSFLNTLAEIGYQGPVTQEVLTKKALQESASVLAKKSEQAFTKIFSALN